MQNMPLLRNFTFSPSLAEGEKGGGLKTQNHSGIKCANSDSTHPLTPSAREGGQVGSISAREGESILDSRKNKFSKDINNV